MYNKVIMAGFKAKEKIREVKEWCMSKKSPGIDGILVTVGLCIIALVLCVVMKESLSNFITTLVEDMTQKAQGILNVGG